MILSKINRGVYLSLFEHANTRKYVYEHSCSYVRVFLSILANLAQFFFLIVDAINEYIFCHMFKQMDTRKYVNEQSCLSVRVFLSLLAHLAHLNKCFNLSMQILESMSVSIAGYLVE